MKNEYKITKQLMMSWAKEYHIQGAANIILFVLWGVVGLMGLSIIVLEAMLTSMGGGDGLNWYIGILLLLLAIFKLFIARYVVWSKRYKLYSDTYGVPEWIRTTEFAQDEIILTDHTSVTKLKYENVKKIKEKGNVVMIFLKHGLALRLYKDAFVEGTWEECKEKIILCSNK